VVFKRDQRLGIVLLRHDKDALRRLWK
jgi:hypothetical protein